MVFFRSRWMWSVNQARRKGLYPKEGKAKKFDVRQLIIKGEQDLAVEVYRQLFLTNRREAQKAVEDLAKRIQEKKPELE